jgi:hypothetical protein
VTDDDGEDVLAELEAELSRVRAGDVRRAPRRRYDPDDYERHSWSRRLRNARHGRPRTDRRFCAATSVGYGCCYVRFGLRNATTLASNRGVVTS